MTEQTLYHALKEINAEIESHESDLYVKKTPEVTNIINQFKENGANFSVGSFVSQIDNAVWYDIPFEYIPFWESKCKAA